MTRPLSLFARIVVAALLPGALSAAELTPFAAFMAGGGFRDQATGADLEIRPSAAGGFILGFPWEENSQLEFYISRQPTKVRPEKSAGPTFDLNMDYYHVGGTVLMDPYKSFQPYFVATVGATHLDPDDELGSELRFSLSAGLGTKYPLTERLALRLEGRGFATVMESESQIFCNIPGTCDVRVKGSTLVQWQAMLGLSYRW